jgi:molybdenum cofactor synthesis domain-containing protein
LPWNSSRNYSDILSALEIILTSVERIEIHKETIPSKSALGRVLAKDVPAPRDVPMYDKSMVDGYAVRSGDTAGASESSSVMLKLVGKVPVGQKPELSISEGEAARIATGSLMPSGSNAAVMIEKTKLVGNRIGVFSELKNGENILFKAEDVRKGEVILSKGRKLGPFDLGLLSAQGISKVQVFKKPRIGILSTGDELLDAAQEPIAGMTYDSNRYSIIGMLEEMGANPFDMGIAPDDAKTIRNRIVAGFDKTDALIVTAGTSVGEKDLVPEIVNRIGKPGLLFHGVAMRPGRPTAYGVAKGKPILLLPGFPMSALLSFYIFGRPLVNKLMGSDAEPHLKISARLAENVKASPNLATLARVRIKRNNHGYAAYPLREAKSGVLSGLAEADGFLVIPKSSQGLRRGSLVEVIRFLS